MLHRHIKKGVISESILWGPIKGRGLLQVPALGLDATYKKNKNYSKYENIVYL